MPVQFILGRAGTGKTRHLRTQMTTLARADPLGPPIYYLVPRQATFEAERSLTAGLGSFSRIRVVSFDQLGKDILTHCGDVGIPEVTAIGRRMVIGHLLRVHHKHLKFYSRSAHRRGLAAQLDATFGEFERAGLDEPTLEKLLNTMEPDDRIEPGLTTKLSDLRLLLNAYNRFIGQDRLDPQRRLALVLDRVANCSLLSQAQLFVDDFYDFTAHERRFLTAVAGLVQAATIGLLIDPVSDAVENPTGLLADLSVFHRTERTYRAMLYSLKQAAVPVVAPILLTGNKRAAGRDLALIESRLFVPFNAGSEGNVEAGSVAEVSDTPVSSGTGLDNRSAVEAIDAPDIRSEVDAVARQIGALTGQGIRYREIGLFVRDMAEYQGIIDASFGEHGLPYFADHRRSAAHHPLLQMVRASLQIARHQWPDEMVMMLVKTGLAGLTDDQTDELENYVLRHRIRGRMWQAPEPWMFTRDLIVSEDEDGLQLSESARIDSYRRALVEKLSPLLEIKKPTTVRELVGRTFSVLESFNVRSTLRDWMNEAEKINDLERRDEHEQVWSEFVQLLDHMVELLGDEPITLIDFIEVLESGLETFDLALIPVKVDQILVGQLDRTRPPELKAVFILGMNEGTFPGVQSEKCVITDRDRRTLRQRNIDLDPDTQRRLLDERFLAYLALTRASHRLFITRPTADARKREAHPSLFWHELSRLIPMMPVRHLAGDSQSQGGDIGTPRQLVSGLMRWARLGVELINGQVWPALYQWRVAGAESPGQLDEIQDLIARAWSALRYTNTAAMDVVLARQLFPAPLQVHVRQMETMAECPFRHFARYGLKLRDRERPDVTDIDLSNAYHDILEHLIRDVIETGNDWTLLRPAQANEIIRTHAGEIGRRLRGELMLSTARNRYLLDRIERNLDASVATMMEIHRRGKFRPAFAGLRFGKGGKLPAYEVTTPSGGKVHLHGQIDRVDFNARKSGFVLNDYKMAVGPLAMDRVYYGLSLQLLTHVLVVQANGTQLVGQKVTPAAAFLLQLLRSPLKVDHPSDATGPEDPNFVLRIKPRGILETRAIPALDNRGAKGCDSDVIKVYIGIGGEIGKKGSSDVADKNEIAGLLKHVERRIGELADRALDGHIEVAPYIMARRTPCPHCEFRSVCRFAPGMNRYQILPTMKREAALKKITDAMP